MDVLIDILSFPFVEPVKTLTFGFLVVFVAMAITDWFQTESAIKRNFPLFGIGRYLVAAAGPPLRQYLFENDRDERPIPRYIRNWIYASAQNEKATVPFGTQLDIDRPGTILMRHSAFPVKANYHPERVLIGPERKHPYAVSRFNISAMSYGSLGANAVLAMSRGAAAGDFYQNTGEGGVSDYHINGGGDLVWQIGTGKFGCRNPDGTFNEEAFQKTAAHPNIKMIELKLSQGAKPGKGGILPKEKITPEIARIRMVDGNTDVISPARHAEWEDAEGMCAFIDTLQTLSNKPVGIKFCLGDPSFLDDILHAFQKTGIFPDYIAIDGAEGGTGAAPLAHTNLLGYPLLDALMLTENKLIEYELREQIRLCASGKIWTGGDLAVAIAAGADFAAAARGFMLSVGCIQALHCNTNFCPAGVATHSKWLQRGLVPEVKGPQVASYHGAVMHDFADVLASCGYDKPEALSRKDIMKVVSWHDLRPMSELVPYPWRKSPIN
ncbi:MAG: FMN-binding glutamate synthase family protein [Myxococcota bacterium]